MSIKLENNKFYLVRFKGFKLDKAWKNPRICRASKLHPDPRIQIYSFVAVGPPIHYQTSMGANDSDNFEVVKEVSSEIAIKYEEMYWSLIDQRDADIKVLTENYDTKLQKVFHAKEKALLEVA